MKIDRWSCTRARVLAARTLWQRNLLGAPSCCRSFSISRRMETSRKKIWLHLILYCHSVFCFVQPFYLIIWYLFCQICYLIDWYQGILKPHSDVFFCQPNSWLQCRERRSLMHMFLSHVHQTSLSSFVQEILFDWKVYILNILDAIFIIKKVL